MTRGQLPKAYLRLDPNVDQQHPDSLADFIRLLCAGARQSHRGRFGSRAILESLFSKVAVRRFYDRGDVADVAEGRVDIIGWDLWQEGDYTVGERMQRLRSKASPNHQDPSQARNGAVNDPSPDSISPSRRLGVKASDIPTSLTPPKPSPEPETAGTVNQWDGYVPEWDAFRAAMAARGFRKPPTPKQRAILWPIVEARPADAARWASETPGDAKFSAVVGNVLTEWDAFRASTREPATDRTTARPSPQETETQRRARISAQPMPVSVPWPGPIPTIPANPVQ